MQGYIQISRASREHPVMHACISVLRTLLGSHEPSGAWCNRIVLKLATSGLSIRFSPQDRAAELQSCSLESSTADSRHPLRCQLHPDRAKSPKLTSAPRATGKGMAPAVFDNLERRTIASCKSEDETSKAGVLLAQHSLLLMTSDGALLVTANS